jgi:NCAIR mutase (PurE)-related protein
VHIMEPEKLKELLLSFKEGKISLEKIVEHLKHLPFEDLGFARIDHHRSLRKGFPEVIYGQGKTPEQLIAIIEKMVSSNQTVLVTKLEKATYDKIKKQVKEIEYNEQAQAAAINRSSKIIREGIILVITAGTSDIPVAEEAAFTAEVMGNKVHRLYDVGVAGIHRLLQEKDILFSAKIIIVAAGMEGALPSVVAGLVPAPVIAIPTSVGYGTSFGGLSALLAMLNSCSSGVAVMNIDNGFGAGYFASLVNRL